MFEIKILFKKNSSVQVYYTIYAVLPGFQRISLIFLSLFFSGCGQEESYPWSDDDLDVVLSENSEKMVLLDFETDW